jgi:hypothetical protein
MDEVFQTQDIPTKRRTALKGEGWFAAVFEFSGIFL